jgi:hypothetical protein
MPPPPASGARASGFADDEDFSLHCVPVLTVSVAEIPELTVDPCSAFLLSNIDGVSTLGMLLDLWGGPRSSALRAVRGLLREGVLRLE